MLMHIHEIYRNPIGTMLSQCFCIIGDLYYILMYCTQINILSKFYCKFNVINFMYVLCTLCYMFILYIACIYGAILISVQRVSTI